MEHLSLEYKVFPLDIVDENSKGGLQAYSISPFVKSVDNKEMYHPTLLRVHDTEHNLVLHAKGTL